MSIAFGIIISVLTGLLASALFWWWQAKLLRPRLMICSTLARYVLPDGTRQCQVKIINVGRRAVADLEVTVRAAMPGLVRADATEILTVRDVHRPWLSKGSSVLYAIRPDHIAEQDRRRFSDNFPPLIASALLDESRDRIDIKDVLETRPDSRLIAYVAASDSFSGARVFERHAFGMADFSNGYFRKGRNCSHSEQCIDMGEPADGLAGE